MENQNNIVRQFEGHDISFAKGDEIMVNATEMAKAFGKQPIDWLKTSQSQEYIQAYSKLNKISLADLQRVTRGGNKSGTWFHEDIALEFARWLSPEFSIWCNNQIKELLTQGTVALSVPRSFAEALRLAAEQQERIEAQQKQIEASKPKVEFFDAVAESRHAIEMKAAANVLHFHKLGRNKLFGILRQWGILTDKNEPYQEYIDRGYFRTIEQRWQSPDGDTHISIKTLVYQRCLDFIRHRLMEAGFCPAEKAGALC